MSDGTIRHGYLIESLNLVVTILCTLVVGVVFCVPMVVLALDFTTREVDVALIITFILSLGCAAAWWVEEPALPIALMIAYAAVLFSVNVEGE